MALEIERPEPAAGTPTEKQSPLDAGAEAAETDMPTEDELKTLRRVTDRVPVAIYLVAVAEVAERFAFRCLTGPMQNYIQNPLDDHVRPGALGLGQPVATALGYFFQFWCYLTPIIGAVVADSWLGRFKTIFGGAVISTVGIAVLFVTSLPSLLNRGAGLPGLILALIVIGLGSGGIKSNVGPLIADQYSGRRCRVVTLKTGERVIVDPDVTIQSIFSRYYWVINLGSSSALVATWVELKVGFWGTYLMSLCVYATTVVLLILGWNQYITRPPQGSIIPQAFRAFWIGLRNWDMDKAKPSYLAAHRPRHSNVPWNDHFIEELKVALVACRVFAMFPIFWTCMGQTSGNTVSLAANMNTYGLPNDFLAGFNPVTVLILIPLLDRFIYPALRKFNIPFRPVSRITLGFVAMGGAVAFAAGGQSMVYKNPDNQVPVFWILPIYILAAASEIFAFLAAIEFAYTKAPSAMKSLISSLNLLSCSIGSVLGFALSPTSTYDKVLVEFIVLACLMGLLALAFYVLFSKYNEEEEQMNMLERETEPDVDG
ncbi:putative Oligopeptide transporter [Seiridium unicorne]|uniref:Oligopeptide transporter n=1 Tax=Seiridium unicorne TaxID=138068 RepID=A0ABR2V9L0_9PEZI